jgi:hypothetical protein
VNVKKAHPSRSENNFHSGLIENKIIYEDSSASAAPSSPSASSADGPLGTLIGGELCSRYDPPVVHSSHVTFPLKVRTVTANNYKDCVMDEVVFKNIYNEFYHKTFQFFNTFNYPASGGEQFSWAI